MRPLHWSNPADFHHGTNAISPAQSLPYNRREQSRLEKERGRVRQMAVTVMLFAHNQRQLMADCRKQSKGHMETVSMSQ